MKRWSRNRINYLHFSYNDFYDFDNFVIEMLQILQENVQYSLLLKVNYNKELYAMGGKQLGFKYISNNDDTEFFENLHNAFKKMLKSVYDNYEVEEVNSIQILIVRVEDMPNFKITNLNQVNFKVFTNERKTKSRFTLIPLTTNVNYFGKLIIKDRELYLGLINKQRSSLNESSLILNDISSMYLYNNTSIIVNIEDNGIFNRYVYDSLSGMLIGEVQDQIIEDNLFIRKIGNNSLTILNDKIIKIESKKKVSSIKYRPKPLKDEPNTLIGSWDIEAFNDLDGYAKVYALGFYVLDGEVKTYYLEDGMTSEELVLKCIDDMLVNKFRGYTFYTHNFGRYDSKFLIKILKEDNIRKGYEYYKLDSIYRDNNMIKLNIKVRRSFSERKLKVDNRKDPGYNMITIVDSLNLLNQSLDKLCESFNVEVVKGNFPHSFVKRDTIHYIGNTPSFNYWDKIKLSEYNKLVKPDWNLKNECLKYLEKDLISLTLIMNKFSEYINRKYHLQVTDSLTISRLALNIFLKEYLKDSKLPIIGKNMFSDIKQAYYGGVTEVYKPYGKNLYYYDVNSLYPFAALNPMPGIDCTYVENVGNSIDINDLFGFFYCEVETDNNYLGLLPVHSREGLIMPNGKWQGWYFSEEIKYALSQGYKIRVEKGYNFNKLDNVFIDYVNDLYKIKSTTKDSVEKDINKRLLNHLLGRFGMNITKPITRLVDDDELSLITSTREILGEPKIITENDYLLTYNPKVNQDICEDHGIDYIKVCNINSNTDIEKLNEFKDVSLTTAAAVTAYARIYMSKIKLDILNKGGSLYYTDTDSIVTDITLDENLVGNELGQFKLEHRVKKGYFISNKTYCLQLFDKIYDKYLDEYKDCVIKSKSVDNKSLTVDSFKELYKGIDTKATKRFAITDYSKGSVLIVDDPNVNLKYDSYTKREKIFKGSKWIDTKPLVLKNSVLETKFTKWGKSSKVDKSSKSSKLYKSSKSSKLYKSKDLIDSVKYFYKIFYKIYMILLYCIMIIGYIILLGLLFFIMSLFITSNNEAISNELELLLESRYNDDYMEEPIDIEIFESISYLDKFKNYLNNFISLFLKNNFESYSNKNYIWEHIPQIMTENLMHEIARDNVDYSIGYRPQVLTNVLKHHLEELNDKIAKLEISKLRRNNLVLDALSLCKKALQGQPYDSPIPSYNSPIMGRGSVMFDYENRFRVNTSVVNSPVVNSSVVNSPVVNQKLINDITALLKSPVFENKSPVFDNNSPSSENSPYLENNSPFSRNSLFTRVNSPVVGNNSHLDVSSPITRNSPVFRNSLITRFNSPVIGNSPIMGNSPVIGNATHNVSNTLIRNINLITINNSPVISGEESVKLTTPLIEQQSPFNTKSLREDGLRIGSQNTFLDTQHNRNITKAPLRDIHSPNTLKRFGNVWPDNISIEDYKPIKRYGSLLPSRISILDDYNPYNKRDGRLWPYGITQLKSNSIIEHTSNSTKPLTSELD